GLRVLVVDSDMRSPSLHHRFKIGNEKGLSNILSGNARWNEVAQDAEFAGVKAITAGPHPPNSADLLSGPGLGTLLAELMGAFARAADLARARRSSRSGGGHADRCRPAKCSQRTAGAH